MSTRGVVGLVIDGEEKIAYNHCDSYPSGVGVDVLDELSELINDVPALYVAARNLKNVEGEEWYGKLRDNQGSLRKMLDAGVFEDYSEFPVDSLFCEWSYIVDLDAGRFEVYKGFQKTAPAEGRWAGNAGNGEYAASALKAWWPLLALPSREDFYSALEEVDE